MKYLLFPLLLLCPPLVAQNHAIQEDFESGAFPPAGWALEELGYSGYVWTSSTVHLQGTSAYHDDWYGTNDNRLVSVAANLSTHAEVFLHYDQRVVYASWRDTHLIEYSLDGGLTYTTAHSDITGDTTSTTTIIPIPSLAGLASVRLAFRYIGDYASEWNLDNILLTDEGLTALMEATNPANGHKYYLLPQSGWNDAQLMAESLGGNLTTIDDQAENDWILQTFGDYNGLVADLWIGFNDVAVEGVFEWADGTPPGFTNWHPNQPDNNGNNENYVHMYGINSSYGQGTWNDMFDAAATGWSDGYFGVAETNLGPIYAIDSLTAGQVATLSASNCEPGATIHFAYSLTGSGPTSTPYGDCQMSPPIKRINPVTADSTGFGFFSTPIPPWTAGVMVYTQAFVVDSSNNVVLTNALIETIQ
jgi:hypothetical protein